MNSETRFQKRGILKRITQFIITLERTIYNAPSDNFPNEFFKFQRFSYRDNTMQRKRWKLNN